MKAIKGRILNKLRSIPQSTYLKQGRILYLKASDALLDPSPPRRPLSDLPIPSQDHNPILPDVIDVAELMKDLDDDTEDEDIDSIINKENTSVPPQPPTSWRKTHNQKTGPDTERQGLSFRPPELDSETLFDPDLLAAFEQAVTDHMKTYEEDRKKPRDPIEDQEPPSKIPRLDDGEFEKRCPPGGEESVILYTTSLRGIRKTFEDCHSVRFLLESSRVVFDERDVSMHRGFRDEMWRVMEERAVPPRLFVKGRYIGGAEVVLRLHEQGRLMPLLQGVGVGVVGSGGAACRECWGVRFVMCDKCSGGRKVYAAGDAPEECDRCNENGLLLCSVCYPAHALLSPPCVM